MKKFCSFTRLFAKLPQPGDREAWASVAGTVAPFWIFIHDTYIVDRARLNSAIFRFFFLFFVFFFVAPLPPWKRLNSDIFQSFLLFFGIFSVGPPGNFSADALADKWPLSDIRVNLPPVTTCLTAQSRGIPSSALPKGTTSEFTGLLSTLSL